MELDELITIWRANDEKLTKAVKLNLKTIDLILSQKVKSNLNSLLWQRIIESAFHAIALILLFAFLIYNINQVPFAISAIALIAFYSFLLINCLRQIQVITSFKNDKNIVSMQKSLVKIQIHMLDFIRLSVLCIPTFLSYPIVVSKGFADLNISVFGDFDIIKRTNGTWWLAEVITFIVLIPLGLWFYKQINIKNIHKKWVARIIKRSSSARVTKAMEYLKELEGVY